MTVLSPIRAHVNALDSTLAVVEPRTMDDVIADGMADTSLQTWLLGAFAGLAVVLAAVGSQCDGVPRRISGGTRSASGRPWGRPAATC